MEVKKKPKWNRPKLTVVVRGKPEEGVLAACKSMSIVGPLAPVGPVGCTVPSPACMGSAVS